MSAQGGVCIIGVARRTVRPGEGDCPEPLDLWEEMARHAADDSGGRAVLEAIDDVEVIYPLSWQYDDAPGRLAERLKLGPGRRGYSGMSGTAPQKHISACARDILAGRSQVALVVGGEALATKKRLQRAGEKPAWSFRPREKPKMPFEDPFHPAEVAHQVFQAYLTFALFDVARRAHLGLAPEENRRQHGELFAPMSEVAAANPHAWLRDAHTAQSLWEVTPDNRMIAYPYPKRLISIMDIDMAAGVILTSEARADALGVPRDRRVYLRGFCHAKDPVYVAERDRLWRSAAMEEASRAACESAGVGIDEIAYLDLYSCFASSVNFARDALGIAQGDPRPLSVTGGLPFHGGPGTNYLSHSVAEMVTRLREAPAEYGMVSGVGMHMQNHTFAIYSARPGVLTPPDEDALQARVVASAPRREIVMAPTGVATIAAYSVLHAREGATLGVAVCDLPGGARCYAHLTEPTSLEAMQREEWVGRTVELVPGEGGVNLIRA